MAMASQQTKPWRRRWTRKEFYKLSECGFFRGQRVELLHEVIYKRGALDLRRIMG
jgi:hypothetical protein